MDKYEFGNRLYEYRTQKGLTQKELGKLLGVTDKAVSKWETGESKPRLDKMNQITELFETSIDGMLGRETADGERLKPYKTIFDARLKKYSQYYKAGRIWTYILALICVVVYIFSSIESLLNGEPITDIIVLIVGMIILVSGTVIFTAVFKPKFDECKSKDMNIFMAVITVVFYFDFVSPLISAVTKGEYNTGLIGVACVEALILAVTGEVSSRKKRYIPFLIVAFVFPVINVLVFDSDVYLFLYALLFQFECFIEKRNWLVLAKKADLEIEKTVRGKKATKIFVTVVLIITVFSIALSSFSPYIIYKVCMMKYYPTYQPNQIFDYDYSAKTDASFTEIEFQGAKLQIPKGYEKVSETEGSVIYKNAQSNAIFVRFTPSEETLSFFDESYMESLEPDEADLYKAELVKEKYFDALCQKHFGVSTDTYYGMKYVTDFVDLNDVRFYESQKAALMLSLTFTKMIVDTGSPSSVSLFDDGLHCGIVQGRQIQLTDAANVCWMADVWYANQKDGAFYTITYIERDGSDLTNHQMICALANSLEF